MAASVFEPEWDAECDDGSYRWRRARVGRQAGCERLGASVFELPPGAASFPLHAHYANEELVLVLAGSLTFKTLNSEQRLDAGDIAACRTGLRGTHQLRNDSDESARTLILSTMRAPAELLGLSLYELPPRFERTAYHFHFGNEELLIALSDSLTLRTVDGWKNLSRGELVAFPRGARGAHRPINSTAEPVRFLVASEMKAPDVVIYPDSEKVLAISRAPGSSADEEEFAHWFRIADASITGKESRAP